MKAPFIILGLGLCLLILCGIVLNEHQKEDLKKDRIIENLKAKSDSFDSHLEECDSSGYFYMNKNNLSK